MSVRVMQSIFYSKSLTATETGVLLAIGDAADDRGFGFLLIETVAKKSKLAPRTVQATIAKLCAGELPILEKRERQNRSSIFRIHVDRIEQMPRADSSREISIEEIWGAGDAPLPKRGVHQAHRGGESDDKSVQSDSPISVSSPSMDTTPPLPSGEAPPEELRDLLGNIIPTADRSVPLEDYVRSGWTKLTADFPRIVPLRAMSPSRKQKIGARAAEIVRGVGAGLTAHDVWDEIFAAVRASQFLRGEAEPGRGYSKPMALSIDYLLRPAQFLRTLERAAIDADDTRTTSDPRTGRQYGPTEQAGRAALARYLARGQRG